MNGLLLAFKLLVSRVEIVLLSAFCEKMNLEEHTMMNFRYCSPTEFVFGAGTENEAGALLKKYGAKNVLVMYGTNSAKASGLLDRVLAGIRQEGISFSEMGGIAANPHLSFAREAMEHCRQNDIDFLLAVGGGSVIDTCKSVAVGVALEEGQDLWTHLYDGKIGKEKEVNEIAGRVLPYATILTHAAAGSEGNDGAVLVNDEIPDRHKSVLHGGRHMRPAFSIMNPELTYTTSAYQTAAGVSDIMAHVFERYFTNTPEVELNDAQCEALLRTVMRAARLVHADPQNYEARGDIMWAGMLAHNDILSCGRVPDMGIHPMELQISGRLDTVHGAGLAVLFPAYMRYSLSHNVYRVARLMRELFGVTNADPHKAALEGVDQLVGFFTSLGLPKTLRELGVKKEMLMDMAKNSVGLVGGTLGNYMGFSVEDCYNIYSSCL